MCKTFGTWSLLLYFAVLLLIPAAAQGPGRTVKVGLFPAAPLVMEKDGVPAGLFVDLVNEFARRENWKIEYVKGTWTELQSKLAGKEIDLLPALGYSDARAKVYDFSANPVFIDSGVLFTGSHLVIHTVFDLQGKKVAALENSIFTKGFEDYVTTFGVNCTMIYTKDNQSVMEAISQGTADAGVCIYSLGNDLARSYPVEITPISFSPIALEFAVLKGQNQDVLAGIDRGMAEMLADPASVYSVSFRNWTAPPNRMIIPSWLWWSLGGLLFLGGFLTFWGLELKRQVQAKTQHLKAEIAVRKEAEAVIAHALAEKETLIRELYHRTKNTLQVIRGLVSLEAEEYPSKPEIAQFASRTESRIMAISLVHQMLFDSHDLSRVSSKDYLTDLVGRMLQDQGDRGLVVKAQVDADDWGLLLDTAVPLGLIVNELVANSLVHGFPSYGPGNIRISLRHTGNSGVLEYRDDGVGVKEGFDFRSRARLGMNMVFSIVEQQMLGSLTCSGSQGFFLHAEFPTNLYEARV